MSKKDRVTLSNVIAGSFLIIGLYLYLKVFNSSNIYWLFGIVILAAIIDGFIYFILPSKKRKKIKTGIKHNRQKTTNQTASNRLRSDDKIIFSRLEDLSGREFERLCYLYFKAKGYRPIETGNGADGGVDLVIYNRHYHEKEAVQIKHYIRSEKKITVSEIRELNSSKRNHKCVLTRFITTSSYTKDALKEADQYKMVCHDINWVKNKILKWQQKERTKIDIA